jgi:predicted permease
MFYLAENGFLQAMGITLERGRFITPQDDENAPVVIDIDDVFARTYFQQEEPIGKHVHLEQFNVDAEIVGVVGHVKQWGPGGDSASTIQAQFFYPFMQLPEKIMPLAAGGAAVVLRAEGDPKAIMGQVRHAVADLDPREVVYGVQTMQGVLDDSLAPRRLSMILLSGLATLALLLSCIGIYGVISQLVGQRTHEIGVRIALGAQAADVMRLILGQGLRMAVLGVLIGVAAALALTRLMASQLFGVSSHDPLTYAAVGVMLTVVALFACYIPARRAVKVNPLVALRYE